MDQGLNQYTYHHHPIYHSNHLALNLLSSPHPSYRLRLQYRPHPPNLV